jgi:alginate production protein
MTIAKFGIVWLAIIVVALITGLPAAAAELTNDRIEGITEDLRRGNLLLEPITVYQGILESDVLVDPSIEHTNAKTGAERSIKEGTADDVPKGQLAQFSMRPGSGVRREAREELKEEAKLPSALKYNYVYGFEMEVIYFDNFDLNDSVPDDGLFLAPTVFGLISYRPNAWFETTLELTLEQLVALYEEDVVQLPDGSLQPKEKKRLSLLVDQALVKFKHLGPFEVTIGRQNYEDDRLWLYDAALDAFLVKLSLGDFHTFGSVSREDLVDGELLYSAGRGKTDNYILYTEYRGIEDSKLGAYAIKRDDTTGQEGEPLHLGARMYGRPSDSFNYWTDLGFTLGKDESNQDLEGYGFDVGATYRFLNTPLRPSITLGYAFGSGDDNPNDNTNHEFRQTGLQSNEGRFGGVTQFKYYGEMFDPELTNLNVFTAGFGFRVAAGAFVDIVYHHYRLDKITDNFDRSAITALINQDETNLSKDVGSEVDIILGFRNLFGLRRLGLEFRVGWFFPGDAYRIPEGDPANPTFRKADQGISMLGVIIL